MSEPDRRASDRRVLEELEQFQLAIRAVRASYVRGSSGAALPASAPALPPGPDPALAARPAAIVAADGIAAGSPIPADVAPPRRRSARGLLAAAVVALTVAALAGAWATNRIPAGSPPAAQPQPAAEPEPAPANRPIQPIDPHALRVDLTTLRVVWLRVSVDGRIAIEREVAAGEQLPFGADHSIVVRAGDAGAVTVRVGGVDQGPIGGDGKVVTRAFEAPAR